MIRPLLSSSDIWPNLDFQYKWKLYNLDKPLFKPQDPGKPTELKVKGCGSRIWQGRVDVEELLPWITLAWHWITLAWDFPKEYGWVCIIIVILLCVNYPHYIFVYFPIEFLIFFLLIIRTLQIINKSVLYYRTWRYFPLIWLLNCFFGRHLIVLPFKP